MINQNDGYWLIQDLIRDGTLGNRIGSNFSVALLNAQTNSDNPLKDSKNVTFDFMSEYVEEYNWYWDWRGGGSWKEGGLSAHWAN